MSVSTFFEKTKAQIKNAVSAHPIEIFLISAFAIGIWFMELGTHKENAIYLYLSLSTIFLVSFFMDCAIGGASYHWHDK